MAEPDFLEAATQLTRCTHRPDGITPCRSCMVDTLRTMYLRGRADGVKVVADDVGDGNWGPDGRTD